MKCEPCYGTGKGHNGGYVMPWPCEECGGTGISYCCDEAGANPPNTFDDVCNLNGERGNERRHKDQTGVPSIS